MALGAVPPEPVIDTTAPQALRPEVEEGADTRRSVHPPRPIAQKRLPSPQPCRSGDSAKSGASSPARPPRPVHAVRVLGRMRVKRCMMPRRCARDSAAEAEGTTPAKAPLPVPAAGPQTGRQARRVRATGLRPLPSAAAPAFRALLRNAVACSPPAHAVAGTRQRVVQHGAQPGFRDGRRDAPARG